MRKWIILILILIIGIAIYSYLYQDHRDIKSEQAEFVMNAKELQSEIETKPSSTEGKYLNKTIEIKGMISAIETNSITLDDIVFCQLNNVSTETLKQGQTIRIKGRFIGYDDLLEEFKLDQCIIIN